MPAHLLTYYVLNKKFAGDKMVIKAVLFDIDGTLIDSNEAHAKAFAEGFEKFGHSVSENELKRLIGMGADDILKKYLTEEEVGKIGEDLKEVRKQIFLEKYFPKLKTFPKLKELFARLHADEKQIALASSASADELKKYKTLLDVEPFYEEETNADDADEAKPEPDIFLAAFSKLKSVEKSEVLVVGDTPYDAQAAIKANLKIIGVNSGGWKTAELIENGCSQVYADIENILANYEEVFSM